MTIPTIAPRALKPNERPKYYVVQRMAGNRVDTSFSDRDTALQFAAAPVIAPTVKRIEVNYGQGPVRIR